MRLSSNKTSNYVREVCTAPVPAPVLCRALQAGTTARSAAMLLEEKIDIFNLKTPYCVSHSTSPFGPGSMREQLRKYRAGRWTSVTLELTVDAQSNSERTTTISVPQHNSTLAYRRRKGFVRGRHFGGCRDDDLVVSCRKAGKISTEEVVEKTVWVAATENP